MNKIKKVLVLGGLTALIATAGVGCGDAKYNEYLLKQVEKQNKQIELYEDEITRSEEQKNYVTQEQLQQARADINKNIDKSYGDVTDLLGEMQKDISESNVARSKEYVELKNQLTGLETEVDRQNQNYPYPYPNNPNNLAEYLSDTRSYVLPQFTLEHQWERMGSFYRNEYMDIFKNKLCLGDLLDMNFYNGEMDEIRIDNSRNRATVSYNLGTPSHPNMVQRTFQINTFQLDKLLRNTLRGDEYWDIFKNARK